VSEQQVIHLPAGFTAAQVSDLVAANAGIPLVLIQPPVLPPPGSGPSTVGAAPPAPTHRDFWLGLIGVLKAAAHLALPIVIPGFGGAAAALLDVGIDDAESAILKNPVQEHWTIDAIRAKQAAVVDPTT
jgi:hypothetical protein